jgi:glyoxalase family protein
MKTDVSGLHHITAIARDPAANLAFYTGVLGLRLVKRTVNFDDPTAYHLYYGDESGTPGSLITFFYWPDAGAAGRVGTGQATALTFSAPADSLAAWQARLEARGVQAARVVRFGEAALRLADPDGIPVEIVGVADDSRPGWTGGGVGPALALRGVHAIELTVSDTRATARLLEERMGHRTVAREDGRLRLTAGPGGSGRLVDLVDGSGRPAGIGGTGTIHHVAWRVSDDAAQSRVRAQVGAGRYFVSPVRDRNYFRSIYFRADGGVLFEVATDVPGFLVDEPLGSLGQALKLPPEFEPARAEIERALPPLEPTATA